MRKFSLSILAFTAGAVLSLAGCAAPADMAQFTPLHQVTQLRPALQPVAQPVNLVRRGPPPTPAPAPVWVSEAASARAVVDFPFGGVRASDLTPISALAERIKEMHALNTVTVAGYADSIGSAVANQRLSLRRALFIKAMLVERGIPAEKIKVVGAGSTDFVVLPQTCKGNLHDQAVCQAPNRRVQIAVTGFVKKLVPGR